MFQEYANVPSYLPNNLLNASLFRYVEMEYSSIKNNAMMEIWITKMDALLLVGQSLDLSVRIINANII